MTDPVHDPVEAYLRARGEVEPPPGLLPDVVREAAAVRQARRRAAISPALPAAAAVAAVALLALALPNLGRFTMPPDTQSVAPSVDPSRVASSSPSSEATAPTALPIGRLTLAIVGPAADPALVDHEFVADDPADCGPMPTAFFRRFCERGLGTDWQAIARGVDGGANADWYAAVARARLSNDPEICADSRMIEALRTRERGFGIPRTTGLDAESVCRLDRSTRRDAELAVVDPDGRAVVLPAVLEPLPASPPRAYLRTGAGGQVEGVLGTNQWRNATIDAYVAGDRLPTLVATVGEPLAVALTGSVRIAGQPMASLLAIEGSAEVAVPVRTEEGSPTATLAIESPGEWRLLVAVDYDAGGYGGYFWRVVAAPPLDGVAFPVDCDRYRVDECRTIVRTALTALGREHPPIAWARVGGQFCPPDASCFAVPSARSVEFTATDGSAIWVGVVGSEASTVAERPPGASARPDQVGDVRACPVTAKCLPLGHAIVAVWDPEGRLVRRFQADAAGRFALNLDPGRYVVEAVPPIIPVGVAEPVEIEIVDGAETEPISIVFRWPEG